MTNTESTSDGPHALPLLHALTNGKEVNCDARTDRTTEARTLGADSGQTCLSSFRESYTFLFGDTRQDGDYSVPKWSQAVDIKFLKAAPTDAIRSEPVEVCQGRKHTFS